MAYKYCPNCGHKIEPSDNYCIKCGFKVDTNADQPTIHSEEKNNKIADISKENFKNKSKAIHHKVAENINHKKNTASIDQSKFELLKRYRYLIIVLVFVIFVAIKIYNNRLPKGLSDPNSVMNYCLKRSPELNNEQNWSDQTAAWGPMLGNGDVSGTVSDRSMCQLLENKRTHRYVFNFKYKDQNIPCYVVLNGMNEDNYHTMYFVYLIPVKKQHIASFWLSETSKKHNIRKGYIDKYFPNDGYEGFSMDDLADKDISLDSSITKPKTTGINGLTVSYDNDFD